MSPNKIGDRITIPTNDNDLRRFVEWHGFNIESGNGQTYTMRRDFSPGLFGSVEQPNCPASIRYLRIIR